METGDNKHIAVFLQSEKQGIGKVPHKSAAHLFEDGWKLPGILAHPFDHWVNRLAEASAQASYFAVVPVLRLDQLRAGGLGEDDRIHYGQRCSSSALRLTHVTPVRRSSSSEARRCSSSTFCASVNGSSSCSRLSQSCAISASRSGGVKRTISSGLSDSTAPAYGKTGLGASHGEGRSRLAIIECAPASIRRSARHD
jgi:hypothetical protein